MAEVLIRTGIAAHDPKRAYFVGLQGGLPVDLPKDFTRGAWHVIGRAESDPERVLVQHEEGLIADVFPAVAAAFANGGFIELADFPDPSQIPEISPEALNTINMLLHCRQRELRSKASTQ